MILEELELYEKADQIRLLALEGIYEAQSGHPGGSLSIAEMLAVLYFKHMRIDPLHPQEEERDRFVLSKGHAAPAYYAALALRGYFPVDLMKDLRRYQSPLQGHPNMNYMPGIDLSTGSLGQGLSAANGMALYAKTEEKDYRVYVICGDGEMQEGQMWEAAMTASQYRLDNVTLLVDQNGLQIDGEVSSVMNVFPLKQKFEAFGWNVLEADGHDVSQIEQALERIKGRTGRPGVILCRTRKGKGVSYMEDQVCWHGAAPDLAQLEQARTQLLAAGRLRRKEEKSKRIGK